MSLRDSFFRPFGERGAAPRCDARAARTMPLRHKLMLLVAFEIVVAGVTQARMNPYHPGVVVEAPAHAGNEIA